MTGSLTREQIASARRLAAARYGGAVLVVAGAVLIGDWVQPLVDADVLLLVAVVLAAWFSGLWPALVAAVVATLALDYFFTVPLYTLSAGVANIPKLLVFMGMAALFATAGAKRRNAERALKKVLDELDLKVRERTADLTRANEQLATQYGILREQITERQRAERELEELAGRLIDAQEQERSRIGRELHDHISQMLGVLTIRLDQLRADEATTPSVAAVLGELRESTAEITDDIHNLSHRLHSSALDYLGLVPALQRLVSEFSSRHGIVIEFTHTAVPAPLPSEVALCLFRVTEEGLNNIVKHSQAKSARVHVSGAADGIHLTIEDAGAGFDPRALEQKAGLGFVSMRERLRVLRGTVNVQSAPSRGTTIDVRIPATSLATPAADVTAHRV